jgi:hypothetical protein
MMKQANVVYGLIAVLTITSLLKAEDSEQYIQIIHQHVADDLITIRREHPDVQPKIYAILDQIEKMSSTARASLQQQKGLKRLVLEKTAENIALKQELATIKSEMNGTKKTLEAARVELNRKLDEEKAHVQQLWKERKDLMNKMQAYETTGKESVANKKKITKELVKAELNAVAQKLASAQEAPMDHSLNRTSTSEPNSPR